MYILVVEISTYLLEINLTNKKIILFFTSFYISIMSATLPKSVFIFIRKSHWHHHICPQSYRNLMKFLGIFSFFHICSINMLQENIFSNCRTNTIISDETLTSKLLFVTGWETRVRICPNGTNYICLRPLNIIPENIVRSTTYFIGVGNRS